MSRITDTLGAEKEALALENKKLSEEKKLNSDEIKLQQKKIAEQLDSLETIAVIEMRDSVFVMNDKMEIFKTKINKIHITVREGVILEIIVTTDSRTFRNKSSIIDLIHIGERVTDKLAIEIQNPVTSKRLLYIMLGDVIKYSPLRSYLDAPYAECDILLSPENKTFLVRESTSISTYFNIAAFTDLKGIGGEPNGLAQFTAEAKFINRTKNIPGMSFIPFNYISFKGGLSKFDNDFKGSKLFNDDSISRRDLLQRSNYYIGIKLNLLKGYPSTYPNRLINDIEFNVGNNFIGSKVYNTLFKDAARSVVDTTFSNVIQNQIYFEPIFSYNRHKNFSMTLSLPFYINSVKKSSRIRNDNIEYWTCPSINLMYYGKRDSGSKLFFRYNYFLNLKSKIEAFSQIQLGYSVNLTEVWGGKGSEN